MNKLKEFLNSIEYTEEMAIHAIKKYIKQKEKRKELARVYYLKNKDKLDSYHANYRKTHPGFRKKATERAIRHKRKV